MDSRSGKWCKQIADIDAGGPFARGDVQLHWCDEQRATSEELEAQIEATWVHELEQAKRTGAVLFNGRLIRCLKHRTVDGALHIDVGPTDYKSFMGTNLRRGESVESIGWSNFANAIGVSALIVSGGDCSAVRHILLGHRSRKVVDQPGFLHTFGGALDETDRDASGVIDVFAAVTRELCEELALDSEDLAALTCLGLVHDRFIWQPELVFAAQVDLPVDELERRVDCTSETAEHDAVELIVDDAEPLARFIATRCASEGGFPETTTTNVTPVAMSALWMHGRQRFGDDWGMRALGGDQ